jgi:hypothetical protein
MAEQTLNTSCIGAQRITNELVLAGAVLYAGEKGPDKAVVDSVSIALAASATEDGMDITVSLLDAAGVAVQGCHALELWLSESAIGAGLTADSYSGTLTASVGAILTALTAKTHVVLVTSAGGQAVLTLVDSANPVDQYVAVKNPLTGRVHVSGASLTNWEGAA